MTECPFSNSEVKISKAATLQRAQCPICGAIRKLHLRSYGFAFPSHKPLDGDPVWRECWVQSEDGQWNRRK
jgi:hypothetical protein